MLRFNSVSLRNFMSFGKSLTKIVLDNPGTTLIVGQDLDNTAKGDGTNGVGKTTILNAICFASYGKPLTDIPSLDDLVNDINKKHCEVILDFNKDNDHYLITRHRKMKAGPAGNNVYLLKNGTDITLDSMAHTNQEIERIIGMPFELFVRIAAFSANSIPFLDLPTRSQNGVNQTTIIESLFDITMLSEKAEVLKKIQMKETDQSIKMLKTQLEQLNKEKARHETQVTSAKLRLVKWEKQRTTDLRDLNNQIKSIDGIDIDHEQKLQQLQKALEEEFNDAQPLVDKFGRELTRAQDKRQKLIKEVAQLETNKCPYCEQEFKDSQIKLDECNTEIKVLTETINDIKLAIDEEEVRLKEVRKKIVAIIDQRTVQDVDGLLKIQGQIESLKQQAASLEDAENPHAESLEELVDMQLDDDVDVDEITELETKFAHQKFLYQLLTKKDSFVRKTLLNKNIPFLNQRLNYYLGELGLPHTVEFTHELTAQISQFGRKKGFGSLSNGQRSRVNLALSMAFRDVLQNLHDHINFCMFDEVLDVGLDAVGIQAAAKMLKRKARDENLSLFIISHREEAGNAFDRTMVVQMEKGFSNIKE